MASSSRLLSIIFVIASATLLGCTGLVTKPMMDAGITPLEISSMRMVVAAVSIFIFILIFKRDKLFIRRDDLLIFVLIGIMRLISNTMLFQTQDETSISLGVVLQMTAPCFVVILSYFIFKQKITTKKIGVIIAIFIGCCLAVGVINDINSLNMMGIITGLCSGFTLALFIMSSKIAVDRKYSPETIVLYCFAIAAIVSLPILDFDNIVNVTSSNPDFIWYTLILGIVMTAVAYLLNFQGLKGLEATTVSILGVIEAIVATLIGWFVFGEELLPTNIIGIAVIIIAICVANIEISSILNKRKRKT